MLRAWWALLAIDLWQVAVRAPGALTPAGVAWLAALYALAVGLAMLVVRAFFRRSRESRRLPRWASAAMAVILLGGAVGATVARGRTGGAPATGDPSALADRPNLLVVVIDTLRADHLGCYGYERPTSPVLDALAAQGVLFEHAYAQSSWTKPSTASLFTGRSPTEHQTLSEAARLPEAEETIAERLRARGYRTAALSANPWITPEYGFDQGVDDFFSVYDERFARATLLMQALRHVSELSGGRLRLYNRVKYLVLGELSTTARDTLLVDEALRWLARHRDRRFFLYVHMMSPHHPYDPPPPFDRFVPDRAHAPVRNHPRKSYRFFEGGDPLSAPALADMVARYDGDVLYADTELGRLLDGLDRLGLGASTAVLVTADHGEEFFEHGNWGHGQSVYNELVRVPLVLRVPGPARTGRVTSPVSHADVTPTLLELAGAPAVPGLAGRSLVHASDAAEPTPEILSELLYRYGEARALVIGGAKLIDTHEGERRVTTLFDLAADPGEQRPTAPVTPLGQALAQALARRVDVATRARSAGADTVIDDDLRRRLQPLGYAQ